MNHSIFYKHIFVYILPSSSHTRQTGGAQIVMHTNRQNNVVHPTTRTAGVNNMTLALVVIS